MKIWVAGHRGMVGSAIVRALNALGHGDDIVTPYEWVDLREQHHVRQFLAAACPDYIFMAAGRVGGIQANSRHQAAFLAQNLQMGMNVALEAFKAGVRGLCYLGSSCMYPRECPQPIVEDALLTGAFEPTNAGYALAKSACARLVESLGYCCAVPCNLYGQGDNYEPERSHVLPALIRRAHEAKCSAAEKMQVWGSGKPMREFLHVDDLAQACVLLMQRQVHGIWNVGSGREISIAEAAAAACRAVGYAGVLEFYSRMPDGIPRKLMDSSRMRSLGWAPRIDFDVGLAVAYDDFLDRAVQHA